MAAVKGPSRIFLARFKNDKKKHVEIKPFKVETFHDFGKMKKVPKAAVSRMDKIATAVLDRYEKVCHETIVDMDRKVDGLINKARVSKDPGAAMPKAEAEAEKIVKTTTTMVMKAAASIQGAITSAVQKELAKERNYAELVQEYKVKVVYSVGKNTIKVAANVIRIAGSGGADIVAWGSLAKSVAAMGKTVTDAAKNESTLRSDLDGAIAEHTKNLWKEDVYQKKEKKTLKEKAKHLWQKHKKTGQKAAAKLKRYDVYIGGLYKQINKSSNEVEANWKKLDKAISKMEGGFANPKARKATAELGPAILALKKNVNTMSKQLEIKMSYADDMAVLLTEQGVKVDRDSFQKKWRDGNASVDMKVIAKEIAVNAWNIKTLAETIGKVT